MSFPIEKGPIDTRLYYNQISSQPDGTCILYSTWDQMVWSCDENGNLTEVPAGTVNNSTKCILQGLVACYIPQAGIPGALPFVFQAIKTGPIA